MRCSCCNRALNDYESTLKSSVSGEYLDTCMSCLDGLEIDTVGRDDLSQYAEPEGEDLWSEEEDDETY